MTSFACITALGGTASRVGHFIRELRIKQGFGASRTQSKGCIFRNHCGGICHGETTDGSGIKSIGYPGDSFQAGISDGE